MKRVFAYCCSASANRAGAGMSIAGQQTQIQTYCDKRGWHLIRSFADDGCSGRDASRPALQKMLAALDSDQKRVDAVVITDFDRLSRDPLVRERFVRRLQHKGADIVSISKSPAPDTAADFASAILRVVEELESKEISRRTLRCMCEAARQGRWTGSTPPFGFRTAPAEARGKERGKRLEIHAGEARTVRRIFDLYLNGDGSGGMSSGAIADRLNERGIQFRNGGRFDERKVRCILFREICAGRRSFNRKVGRSGKLKDRSDWVLVAVPAIVSRAVYERAQKDRRRRIRNDARTRWRPSKSRRS